MLTKKPRQENLFCHSGFSRYFFFLKKHLNTDTKHSSSTIIIPLFVILETANNFIGLLQLKNTYLNQIIISVFISIPINMHKNHKKQKQKQKQKKNKTIKHIYSKQRDGNGGEGWKAEKAQ